MADMFYPQLKTGAIAHHPVRKTIETRTVTNVLPGGNVFMYPDEAAQKTIWSWEYVGATVDEATTILKFFEACEGRLRPFTFLDPVGNLLSGSSDFRSDGWQLSSMLTIVADLQCALAGTPAVTIANHGQAIQEVMQALQVPGHYWYCFSIYVSSNTPESLTLFQRSTHAEKTLLVNSGPDWRRFSISGNLQDQTTGLSVGVKLFPGQQVSIAAAQLEAQPGSSAYRSGRKKGDVYPRAHWNAEELSVHFVGPNSCALSVSIEA